MSKLASLEEQKLLINGYCRIKYMYNIPLMLIQLIFTFFNEIFYWKIKKEELKQLLLKSAEENISSNSFIINNIKFEYLLYPKGRSRNEGVVECGFRIECNDLIEYVVVNGTFYCKEADTFIINTRKCIKKCRVITSLIKSEKLKNMDELNIYYKLEIIRIEPKDTSKYECLLYHKSDIKLSKNIHLEWKFDNHILQKIKSQFINNCKFKLYSPCIDNNTFMIKLFRIIKENNKYGIGFQLFCLPQNIKQIACKYTLQLKRDGVVISNIIKTKNINYDVIHIALGGKANIDEENMSNTKSLIVSLDIEIQKIIDFNDKQIVEINWSKYDIC